MSLSFVVAAFHLLALPVGVVFLLQRSFALRGAQPDDVKKVLLWDNHYGVWAILWLGSGVWRAFGGLEKGSAYYLSNHVFWLKMTLLVVLLILEGYLATTFVRWRLARAKGKPIELARRPLLLRLHQIELGLILGMVVSAAFLARGVGVVKPKGERAAEASPALVAQGGDVYRFHCLACHQKDGRGLDGQLAADFVGDASRLHKSDAELLQSIADGVRGTAMPPFRDQLSEEERRAVLAYLRQSFGAAR